MNYMTQNEIQNHNDKPFHNFILTFDESQLAKIH